MVSPLGMPIFRRFLRSNPSLKVQITVEDVEKCIGEYWNENWNHFLRLILRNEFRPRLERMARLRRRLKRGGRWIQRRSIVSPLFGAFYIFLIWLYFHWPQINSVEPITLSGNIRDTVQWWARELGGVKNGQNRIKLKIERETFFEYLYFNPKMN